MKRVKLSALAAACVGLMKISTALGAVCNVPASHATIQLAIDDLGCTEIHVAPGTYVENLNVHRHTWLIGTGGVPMVRPAASGVSIVRAVGTNFRADNIAFSDGNALHGGGIFCSQGGGVFLNRSVVTRNRASGNGGGIYANDCYVALQDTDVTDNTAMGSGGGIYARGVEVGIFVGWRIRVTNNRAGMQGGGLWHRSNHVGYLWQSELLSNHAMTEGGGLFHNSTHTDDILYVVQSTMANNIAEVGGGGIRNEGAMVLHTSVVESNQGRRQSFPEDGRAGGIWNGRYLWTERSKIRNNGTYANGGGLLSDAASATWFVDSTVANNTVVAAFAQGGGVYNQGATLFWRTTVSGNAVIGDGGGLFNAIGATGYIYNSTLAQNVAGAGSAVVNRGTVYLASATLSGNAGFVGDALFTSGPAAFVNTIFDANTHTACYLSGTGTLASFGHNLAPDTSCNLTAAGDLPSTPPSLVALANNGGPTRTQALDPKSAAINAGDDTYCPTQDQRHAPRVATCDIGAYEASGIPITSSTAPSFKTKTVPTTIAIIPRKTFFSATVKALHGILRNAFPQ